MRRNIYVLSILILALAFISNSTLATSAGLEGNIKDATTGEPLIGANVILLGTSLGAAADSHGKYVISNVPSGTYTVRVTYIGYKQQELQITLREDETTKQDFSLEPTTVEGNPVVVNGQASGQTQAINQQLSSDQITSIISTADIQKLPDANAAESLGRLPGMSVLRNREKLIR